MKEVKFGEAWKTCPFIEKCSLPAVCCYNCWKYQRVARVEQEKQLEKARIIAQTSTITKEVLHAYDEYRPCDT